MQKRILVLFFYLLSLTTIYAKDRVIDNPVIDFNQSGVTHITKIVLTDTETRMYVLDKFIPGWWVRYDRGDCLVDNVTGKRYPIQDIIGGKLGEEMFMNSKGSGDSARVLIFPPIDKTVKKVDFMGEQKDNTSFNIYGISLNPKDKPKPKTVPATVQKWLAKETSKAKRKTLLDIDGGEFFVKDTARIVGYIKGYDPRAGFSEGFLNNGNNVIVYEDGRFEGSIALDYPNYIPLLLGKAMINFYIEPGQTLSMILDWEEFRKADRKRNIKHIFTDIRFDGATAGINSEMCVFFAKLPDYNIQNFYNRLKWENSAEDEYIDIYNSELGEYNIHFQNLLENENLQPRTKRLLQIYRDLNRNVALMHLRQYDFFPDFPQNDILILAFPNIHEITYILENNKYIMDIKLKTIQPKKSLKEYLYEELGLEQTAQDSLFHLLMDSISENRNVKFSEEHMNLMQGFFKKYEKQSAEYSKIYVMPKIEEFNNSQLPRLEDSVFTYVLKIKPGLLYNLIQIKKYEKILCNRAFTASEKAEIKRSFADILPLVQSLIDESDNIEKMFTLTMIEKEVIVNENPVVENEKLMEAILEKYKGKVVFVDFWTASCTPCFPTMKAILSVKKELQTKDVVFLYITGETSPVDVWIKKIPEIHGEHYRLTDEQWSFLCNKLGIKDMPAYLIYDKNGNIASELYTDYPGNKTIKDAIEKELSK
jgi:thiol-disulfide isomerase/thioredoxin